MPITPEFTALIDRLNQEINQTSQQATQGLNLVRELLSRFPNNVILTQYFAYFNTALLFIETSRVQIQTTVETVEPNDVSDEIMQNALERLGTLLGRVLEAKLRVEQLINRLDG